MAKARKKKKARIGFIGAGWWASANHLPILARRDDVELAAVCRLGKTELQQVQEHFHIPYGTEDFRKMLDEVELDGVVVTTPHTVHYEPARACLEQGLHVMCEKPFCTRAEEARDLVRIAAEKNLHLLVPLGWNYKPFFQEAKRRVQSGVLGSIQFLTCHMASPIRDLLTGAPFPTDDVGGQASKTLFTPAASTWADPKVAGGGYGHSQLSHSTGMLCGLTGLRAAEVYARMAAPGSRVELYDAIIATFEGGAIGSVSGAGTVPISQRFQVDIRIWGSDGMLLLDFERTRMEIIRHDGKSEALKLEVKDGDYSCEGPPNNFADLILGKDTVNGSPGEASMRSVEILDAAYRSAVSGKPEKV
ncbi:MAG: Gfo/Idh/MocA family oxidoreductase [Planctomycetes bacterium]|nr:Gfo/Idh/MocA family oxidoreductase [Planctomycetota bacterium]